MGNIQMPASRFAMRPTLILVVLLICLLPGCDSRGEYRYVVRATVDSDGNAQAIGTHNFDFATLSADGRYVVFTDGNDLVSGDINDERDVYLFDTVGETIELVSVDSAGNAGTGRSLAGFISGDGTRVLFVSGSLFAAGHTPGKEAVYLRDRTAGTTSLVEDQAKPVSLSRDGQFSAVVRDGRLIVSDLGSFPPASRYVAPYPDTSSRGLLSADGRYVAFESSETDIVSGAPDTGYSGAFIADMNDDPPTYTNLGLDEHGDVIVGDDVMVHDFSSDGRCVLISTSAQVLDSTAAGTERIYLVRWQESPPVIEEIGVWRYSNYGRDDAFRTSRISGNGRYVLIDAGPSGYSLVEALDRQTGRWSTVSLSEISSNPGAECLLFDVSDDGSRLAFYGTQDAYVTGPHVSGVFVSER